MTRCCFGMEIGSCACIYPRLTEPSQITMQRIKQHNNNLVDQCFTSLHLTMATSCCSENLLFHLPCGPVHSYSSWELTNLLIVVYLFRLLSVYLRAWHLFSAETTKKIISMVMIYN